MGFGGGSGGSNSISGASDAALDNPVTDEVLAYDGTVSKWTNASVAGGDGEAVTFIDVYWEAGDYPVQPSSYPANVKRRQFWGPEEYSGPTVAGVFDVYFFTELA